MQIEFINRRWRSLYPQADTVPKLKLRNEHRAVAIMGNILTR